MTRLKNTGISNSQTFHGTGKKTIDTKTSFREREHDHNLLLRVLLIHSGTDKKG